MIIYPAIDIREGHVVRLVQGDPNQETVHSHDPVEMGRRWVHEGAEWIHVVNLDGALSDAALRLDVLAGIASVGSSIQFGGGLRTLHDVQLALDGGVTRVILGTMAVNNPDVAGEAVQIYGPDAIAVALDARDGKVATKGWQESSNWSPVDLGKELVNMGVRHILYTDISRDGMLGGVNVSATAELAQQTGALVIASGGVASMDDIFSIKAEGLAGVVIGSALYSGAINLQDAIELASN